MAIANKNNMLVSPSPAADNGKKPNIAAEDYAYSLLLSWAAYCWPGYRVGSHHRRIAEALQAVERGDITRLIISVPPRHGKSMLASEFFPAWFLGRNPDNYVIAASYGQDLADDFGRKVRNLVASDEFGAVFPGVALADDSASAKRFCTTRGGIYCAVGVGTAITGRGAHLLLIDDPVKNREEADSEIQRRRMKEWYTSTAYTRLMPGGKVVIILTRWHEDDLAGWLLSDGAEEWTVLSLPAIADGMALWPEQYGLDDLERIRQTIGQRDWSALYMQEPAPETGDYFRREWIRYYDRAPEGLTIYGASDYAVTGGGGDYTEHGVAGVDRMGNIYLLDWWRGQAESATWIDELIFLVEKWHPVEWAEESGVIVKSIGPYLDKRMRESGNYVVRRQYPSVHSKEARAQAIRGMVAQGKVFFPRTAWADTLITQMLTFPAGKHDDGVDVLSLFGRMGERAKARATRQIDTMPAWAPMDAGMGMMG